jgi:hypothetical protein
MKVFAFAVLLAVSGCAHDEKLSDQPTQAEAQIQNWVPIGTSQADAQRIMEQHHFTCSMATNSSFENLTNINFLRCNYRLANNRFIPTVYQEWMAAVVLDDGNVSTVHVKYWLTGL